MFAPQKPLRPGEFVALVAMLFATIAFSIDAMLPALPQIAAELTPDDVNRAQLILTSFVLGMGLGSFVIGPLSDALGRKPVIIGGMLLYSAGAILAALSQSLEAILLARVLQGLGVSAPRIVSMAMVRDLYSGGQMAQVSSFIMMVFILVPAAAPALGTVIIAAVGWRGLFAGFVVFAAVSGPWLALRQPETLPPDRRRPLQLRALLAALREVLGHRIVVMTTMVLTLLFGALFATLSSTQQIFGETFGRGASFPFWFALIALLAGTANILNARLVMRLGMRFLVTAGLGTQVLLSTGMALMIGFGLWPDGLYFPAYVFWTTGVFFTAGLCFGNLNALALEPMGHIAGMAASLTSAISTVLAVLIAAPLGLAFDGTPLPLTAGVAVLAACGWALMRAMPRKQA